MHCNGLRTYVRRQTNFQCGESAAHSPVVPDRTPNVWSVACVRNSKLSREQACYLHNHMAYDASISEREINNCPQEDKI